MRPPRCGSWIYRWLAHREFNGGHLVPDVSRKGTFSITDARCPKDSKHLSCMLPKDEITKRLVLQTSSLFIRDPWDKRYIIDKVFTEDGLQQVHDFKSTSFIIC